MTGCSSRGAESRSAASFRLGLANEPACSGRTMCSACHAVAASVTVFDSAPRRMVKVMRSPAFMLRSLRRMSAGLASCEPSTAITRSWSSTPALAAGRPGMTSMSSVERAGLMPRCFTSALPGCSIVTPSITGGGVRMLPFAST